MLYLEVQLRDVVDMDISKMNLYLYLYLLRLYPGCYSYTEGATWKVLDAF